MLPSSNNPNLNIKVESWLYYPLNEFRFIDYSKKDQVLLEKRTEDSFCYYLSDINIGLEEIHAHKLFSLHRKARYPFARFSTTGEQVVFRTVKKNKKVWKIIDIKTKNSRIIESVEGSVVSASILDYNNFLYVTNPKNERMKAYLVRNNRSPLFLGNGGSVVWAPNGSFFVLEAPLDSTLSLREKYEFGQIPNGEYKRQLSNQGGPKREIFRRYSIFNNAGKKLLVLKDFDFVDWIQWSPDSKKLVLNERSDRGFKIVYLNFMSENHIAIDSVYHFPGIPDKKKGVYTCCQNPKWSPDSKRVLFSTEVEDGHQVLELNTYILEDQKYRLIKVNYNSL